MNAFSARTRVLAGPLALIALLGALACAGGPSVDDAMLEGERQLAARDFGAALRAFASAESLATLEGAEALAAIEPELRRGLARARLESRDLDGFADQLKWLEAHTPKERTTLLLRAEYETRRGRHQQAAALFRKLVPEYPDWMELRLAAGWAHFHNEGYVASRRNFDKVLELSPDHPSALVGIGACIVHDGKDWDLAEYYLSKGLELDSEQAMGHQMMAAVLVERRSPDPAAKEKLRFHAGETLRLQPDNSAMLRFVRRAGWYELLPEGTR